MKTRIIFAVLLLLAGVPTRANDEDDGNKAARSPGDLELMEIAQEVDKALLREAMLQIGRQRMELPGPGDQRQLSAARADHLEHFINEKKQAIVARAAELKQKAIEEGREKEKGIQAVSPPGPTSPATVPPVIVDDHDDEEK